MTPSSRKSMVAQFFEKSEDTEIEQQPETIVIQESEHVTEEKENEYVEKQPEKVTIDEENDTSALQLSMSSEASIESSEANVEVIEEDFEAQTNVETEIIASQSSPKVDEVAKGQLISKCLCGVIVWIKIPTKKFDKFCLRIQKVVK